MDSAHVSGRKKAEEALFELASIVESSDDAIIGKTLDGMIVSWNSGAQRIYGYSAEEVIGRHVSILVPPQYRDEVPMILDRIKHGERVHHYETVRVTKDGRSIEMSLTISPIFDADGRITGASTIARDIAERKRAEEEQLRLATVIEQAVEIIIMCKRDGTIQYVNPSFERISGYSRKEVIGRNVRIQSGKHDKELFRSLRDTIERGEVWTGHLINKKKDGALFEVEATVSPIRDKSGEIINYVSVQRDVTREVELERQLRQAQKMEAIGALAGGIAHDFNNILGAIITCTEMAMEDVPAASPVREDLEHVLKASYRGKNLIKQILAFSRRSEKERQEVQMDLIARECLRFLRASLPATIEIRQNIPCGLSLVWADPTQIHQVIMNLCTNAVHAMREKGGVLEVSIVDVDLGSEFETAALDLETGPYLRLSVSDTGHGMDRTVLERIFDPFFTTKGQGEGTGLGLSVTHGIVKSHGGAITVNSEPGKGTTFHVFFPRLAEARDAPEGDFISPVPRGDGCILFVDDEEDLVYAGRKTLKRFGYEVIAKTNSIEALESFRTEPHRFDLVITDQTMPQMTGVQLAREILRIRSDIPIILCTGFSPNSEETTTMEEAKAAGVRELVMKPLNKTEMAQIVRRLLNKSY
jgi:PAS domain S-box-containing protein